MPEYDKNEFSSIVVSIVILFPKAVTNPLPENMLHVLQKNFPYYELLAILNPFQGVEKVEQTLMAEQNVRCIVMNASAPESILKKKALEEAIGDQVVLWNFYEADPMYIPELVKQNISGNDFCGLICKKRDNSFYGICSRVFTTLVNKLTGYFLHSDLSSIGCYSRNLVNAINAQEWDIGYMKLLLASIGFKHTYITGASHLKHGLVYTFKRMSDSLEIIGSVPHKLLQITAWFSVLSCLACFAYIFYVGFIWVVAPTVQPGWTTTSLILSVFFGIVFFSLFVFSCIFLNRLKQEGREHYTVARESTRNDFIKTFSELNITDKS